MGRMAGWQPGRPVLAGVLALALAAGCTSGPGASGSATTAGGLTGTGSAGTSATGTGAAGTPGPATIRGTGPAGTTTAVPLAYRPDHVLIVVFENRAFGQIAGSSAAPYLNALVATGAVFTDSRGVTHPSQPNYLALFSGSSQGVTDDRCPVTFATAPNLGRQLLDAGYRFVGYSEDLPRAGYTGCTAGRYARKHNPWVDFATVPAQSNQPATAFPADLASLPTVAFLIPNLCSDMHDCGPGTGDAWARTHLDGYVQWARTHNSLLIVTFDEDDHSAGNKILTIFVGPMVQPGRYPEPITHYRVLATVEYLYALAPLGPAGLTPIVDVWR